MEIENKEILENIYGSWPSFHDSEILNINLYRGEVAGQFCSLVVSFYLYETKAINEGTAQYEIISTNQNVAIIEFQNIENLNLEGFNHQNVIEALNMEEKGKSIQVEFESIFGVQCGFSCSKVTVLGVEPKGKECA